MPSEKARRTASRMRSKKSILMACSYGGQKRKLNCSCMARMTRPEEYGSGARVNISRSCSFRVISPCLRHEARRKVPMP